MGSNPETQPLPFWQVNVRPEDRKEECPEALRNLSDKDMDIIGTRDEDYHVQSWDEVVYFVRKQRLADFRRWPTELRRYREFVWRLGREKGGVMGYILRERLHWTLPLIPRSSKPFECDEDYKILWNDWPYGLDNRIVHLVVWTKFELQDNDETEAEIEKFIKRTFFSTVAEDQLIWFKNPPSLKSVHSVEHIHVMLFCPEPEFIDRITNGDRPRGQLLSRPIVSEMSLVEKSNTTSTALGQGLSSLRCAGGYSELGSDVENWHPESARGVPLM